MQNQALFTHTTIVLFSNSRRRDEHDREFADIHTEYIFCEIFKTSIAIKVKKSLRLFSLNNVWPNYHLKQEKVCDEMNGSCAE